MGGAEGTGKLIFSDLLFYFLGSIFFFFFVKSNTSLVFSLRRLQVEGDVPAGLQGCSAAVSKQTGFCWSVLVWLVALSACAAPARLNEPAPFCSLCH